jgi:hypothetical protein
MMIKSALILFFLMFCSFSYGQDVLYQSVPTQSVVYFQAPTVSFVPILVQKEMVVHTWEFRPIVIPNFMIYQYQPIMPLYYHGPCVFSSTGSYYSNGMIGGTYRY